MTMEIEIKDGRSDNLPLPKDKLVALIQESYDTIGVNNEDGPSTKPNSNTLIKSILEKLEKHSSLYKYVASVTTLYIGELDEVSKNFSLKNDIGASWQSKKDGIFNHKLEDKNNNRCYLITILWLHK
ncbi:YER071C [Saccharomyces arboricola H-6]|uniref:Topoisomerase I damage affected protein 2 n=1 Tax=Saccharomyces arboricola (strain H-6 / AS 2.3317 / CBS 10644) TaxID=1160507 RepID=J8PPA2_SACAR|nr:YER071C [Saccharomyces arboricola H-6]